MRVIGIDPSLTNTGVAIITGGGVVSLHKFGSKATTPSLADRAMRIGRQVDKVAALTGPGDITLAVIEQPAYSRLNGHQHERSGLWWGIVWSFLENGAHVVEVTPSARAKYATGKGNAAKGAVIDAVTRRYPHVETGGDDNLCDALVLAAMGRRWLGDPIDDMPQTHVAALDKVMWPEGVTS